MKINKGININIILLSVAAGFIVLMMALYLLIIPRLVSSINVQNFIKSEFYKMTNANLVIENPELKTSLKPIVEFEVDKLEIIKNNEKYFVLNDFEIELSFAKLFAKKVDIKELSLDKLFCDVTNLLTLFPSDKKEKKETKPSDFKIGLFNSDIDIKDVKLLYDANGVLYDVGVKNISLSKANDKNFIHFITNIFVTKGNQTLRVVFDDDNNVYLDKKKLVVENGCLHFNESIVNFDAMMDIKNNYNFSVHSKDFKVENVIDIVESDILIPNGSELLSLFSNIRGVFDFNVLLNNNGLSGNVDVKKVDLGLVPLDNIPLSVSKGKVEITSSDIYLKDFVGYYKNNPVNEVKFGGSIKDYMKTFDTNIDARGIVTNDFMVDYLSKMIGYPIALVGEADAKLNVKMKDNVIDIKTAFWINPEDDLLVGGEPFSKYRMQRVIDMDMQIKGMMLELKKVNYYINAKKDGVDSYRKILNLVGKIDFSQGISFKEMGFEVSEALPSEFLNLIARCDLFKGGTVVGKLKAIEGPKGVKLFGNINLSKIRVPSQRIYIENGVLSTNFDTININANGRYRRTKYDLNGEFVNNIAFPVIVNKLALNIDKINIDRLLQSMNMQGETAAQQADLSNDDDITPTFDVSNLIIKDCSFTMGEGIYKELAIKDLVATMTLDEHSDLHLHSNKFGFAKGSASCNVCCDLKNHKYNVRIGAKDVDSNAVAYSLLGLKDQISGNARGLIELNTDHSLKLNGNIKFDIQNGTIGTVGFLQYVLNVASVFRNPLAMISPATLFDLVNIPEGDFNVIYGDLAIKDNVVNRIKIKSRAPLLSSYIVGRYNLEDGDTSLRIYTKFANNNTGIYGFLRYLSLSSLARNLPISSRTLSNFYNTEIKEIPSIDAKEKDCQIYLTKVEGDVINYNFISFLKRLK